jgi:hypothetical protein
MLNGTSDGPPRLRKVILGTILAITFADGLEMRPVLDIPHPPRDVINSQLGKMAEMAYVTYHGAAVVKSSTIAKLYVLGSSIAAATRRRPRLPPRMPMTNLLR